MKNCLLILSCCAFLWVNNAGASLPSLSLSPVPDGSPARKYENKEYEDSDEFLHAYLAGKCSSMWIWAHLSRRDKKLLVEGLKKRHKENLGVTIKRPAGFYVEAIDQMLEDDPEAVHYQLGVVFRALAVIHADYDEGISRSATERKHLGGFAEMLQMYRAREDKLE